MPRFTVQDPDTGRTVTLEGDSAPTERELVKVFNQLKTPQEKAIDTAGDVAAEFGPMIAGQMIGAETGLGYFAIAPAAGAYGTYARQKRQIERGERDDYNYWEMLTSGLINAVPASAYLRGGASMGQYLGRTAAIGAATAAGPEAVKVAQKAAEEKRIPSYDEYLSIAKEGAKGAAIGSAGALAFDRVSALSGPAQRLWNRIAGRTQEEANQILQQVAETGTRAEQAAAAEMVDTVGQQMGFVRPSTAIRSAEESAAAMGVQPVKSARESASVLAEAPLTQAEVESRRVGTLEPKSARESAEAMGLQPAKSARESAEVLSQATGPAEQSAATFQQAIEEGRSPQAAATLRQRLLSEQTAAQNVAMAEGAASDAQRWLAEHEASLAQLAAERNLTPAQQSAAVFQQALAEGQSPQAAAALRQRFMAEQAASQANLERARQFQQARAEELQQSMRGQQAAGAESVVLESQGPQGQMHVLDTRPGASARERERLRQRMGIAEEELPTTEDVLNQLSSLRGIDSKQKARKFMESGRTNAGLMAGIGALGVAGLAATDLQAKPDTIIVKTPAGDLKYDPSVMSLDEIQQDAAKKVSEWRKLQAAAPHLDNRANYENAPDDKSRLDALLSWSNSRKMLGDVAKATIQAGASQLPLPLRAAGGAAGEVVRGQIAGETPTQGQIAASAVASIPRGGTEFGPNAAKFAGANVAGEMLKQFMDDKEFTFKDAAEAAAKGGLQAATLQGVMRSPLAAGERRRVQAAQGDIEVFNDASRLGIVIDPAAQTNPTRGQELAVKLAGGSPRFSHDASRVNVPRVTEIFQGVAGSTGNPQLDQNLSPAFFRARLAQEGRVYDTVSRLPGMRQVVEDWKQANFNSARQYRLYGENANPDALAAARQFRAEADNLFQQIEQAASRNGGRGLVDDLRNARVRIAELHAVENAVNPADYRPDQVQLLGQMYRDNPRYFTGDLASVARIAAAQPQVFQNVRMSGTKAFSQADLTAVPYLRSFLQTAPGQKSIGTTGLDPTFLAQLARYGTGAAVQQAAQPSR